MDNDLNLLDIEFLLESLRYARVYYDSSKNPPPYEEKREKSLQFDSVTAKLRAIRDAQKRAVNDR